MVGARQCRGRIRRPRPPLSVRREAGWQIRALDGHRPRRPIRRKAHTLSDRLQHPDGGHPQSVLCRRAQRRPGDPAKIARQEGHCRRHRARTRRPLQRPERRHPVRPRAADTGRGIAAAEPRAAMDLARRHAERPRAARLAHAVLMAPPFRRQARGAAGRNGGRSRSRRVCPAGGFPAHSRHLAVSHRHHRLHRGDRARRNRHPRSARQGRRKPLSARGDVARRRPDLYQFELPDHGLESRRDRHLRLSARTDDRPLVRRDLRSRRSRCHALILHQEMPHVSPPDR